jgi:hypothetical protein
MPTFPHIHHLSQFAHAYHSGRLPEASHGPEQGS